MPLSLVADDFSWVIELPLDDQLIEALAYQVSRAETDIALDVFRRRLLRHVAPAVIEALDPDLKPPTTAQIRYAKAIAKRLGIDLPEQSFRNREAMKDFIHDNVEAFKKK